MLIRCGRETSECASQTSRFYFVYTFILPTREKIGSWRRGREKRIKCEVPFFVASFLDSVYVLHTWLQNTKSRMPLQQLNEVKNNGIIKYMHTTHMYYIAMHIKMYTFSCFYYYADISRHIYVSLYMYLYIWIDRLFSFHFPQFSFAVSRKEVEKNPSHCTKSN